MTKGNKMWQTLTKCNKLDFLTFGLGLLELELLAWTFGLELLDLDFCTLTFELGLLDLDF